MKLDILFEICPTLHVTVLLNIKNTEVLILQYVPRMSVAGIEVFQNTFKEAWGGFSGVGNTERAQHYNSAKKITQERK